MRTAARLLAPSLATSLALLGPAAAAPESIAPPESLVLDPVPPLPRSIGEAAGRYGEGRSATLLSFRPDRREMLIATRFADTAQIHRVAFPGGARTQLTFFPDRVLDAAYPPAGAVDHFVFSKDVGGGEFYQLYRYDLPDGKITLLTDGKSRNVLGPYARDGKRLAYTSTRRTGKDTDLYVMDPRDPGSDRRVAELAGGGWQPLDFSPDGKTLLVQEYVSVNEAHLWLFDVASGERKPLTDRQGEKALYEGGRFTPDGRALFTVTDKGGEFRRLVRVDLAGMRETFLTTHIPWDVVDFDLSRDGRTLAVVTNEDGTGVLRLFDARSGKERPRPALPAGSVGDIAFHPSGRDLGFHLTNARSPNDVYTLELARGKIERWTESELGGVDVSDVREPELVRWKSFDGREISGYLYLPPARFAGKRPVVINIHGGPEGQYRPLYPGRTLYALQELGVAYLFPNVRGSTGYGKTFTKLDNGKLREDSVKDIGALLDWMKTRPELDTDRVMVAGGSYGGYMSYAVSMRYAERIRCSLAVVAISSFVTFLERTEGYRRDLRRVEYGDEREPEMRAFFDQISPLKHVARIAKPIFIVQGQNDPRVPAGEAAQIVTTLKQQKTPVWYLLAKDEGHGFAKKRNQDFLFYATIAFIKAHLL